MFNEYVVHFHYIYIDGKENAKMTGDQMKMLMLTLPLMVGDLIAPEVLLSMQLLVYTNMSCVDLGVYWYVLVCTRLSSSMLSSRTPRPAPVFTACSQYLIQVTRWLRYMDWNIATCQSSIPESELPDLHQKAVDLLSLLQQNLPDKAGKKGKEEF